ncbi:MAG: M18 family aminopeptidase [Clostridia bacterium]|nr:M18 family aminopeptidase [Clostridia bacterium]
MTIEELLGEIAATPTAYHAAARIRARLEEAGYEEAGETLLPGKNYFVPLYGSALAAFRLPEKTPDGFVIAAAHADSPCFRIRDAAELPGGPYLSLSAERYGGMIHESWLDLPLSVAGRVFCRAGHGVEARLVDFRRDTALIPRVAIHLNHEANNGAKADPARDLIPLYGLSSSAGSFGEELAREAGVAREEIVSTDLFLYNRRAGTVWGARGEFFSAPRLDDLACVYTCLEAFLTAKPAACVPVLAVFDNEEIGSLTKQGAMSAFLPGLLSRIAAAYGAPLSRLLASSLALSCDNGHARHPNRPELADRSEAPVLGGGPVVKHSPRYATDGLSAALFTGVCRRRGIPCQNYSNRPDQPGGSTIGNMLSAFTPVSAADIGIAQLAMHSAYETAAVADVCSFTDAVRACYETSFAISGSSAEIL